MLSSGVNNNLSVTPDTACDNVLGEENHIVQSLFSNCRENFNTSCHDVIGSEAQNKLNFPDVNSFTSVDLFPDATNCERIASYGDVSSRELDIFECNFGSFNVCGKPFSPVGEEAAVHPFSSVSTCGFSTPRSCSDVPLLNSEKKHQLDLTFDYLSGDFAKQLGSFPGNFSFTDDATMCGDFPCAGESANECFGSVSTYHSLGGEIFHLENLNPCEDYAKPPMATRFQIPRVEIDSSFCDMVDNNSWLKEEEEVDVWSQFGRKCVKMDTLKVPDSVGISTYDNVMNNNFDEMGVDLSVCPDFEGFMMLDNSNRYFRNLMLDGSPSALGLVMAKGVVLPPLKELAEETVTSADNSGVSVYDHDRDPASDITMENAYCRFTLDKEDSIVEEVGIEACNDVDCAADYSGVDEIATSSSMYFNTESETCLRNRVTDFAAAEVNANTPLLGRSEYDTTSGCIKKKTKKKKFLRKVLRERKCKESHVGIT